ncbi:MAG TPA: DUF1598 domain-containing protein [Lacipirellulaceae bacterium]
MRIALSLLRTSFRLTLRRGLRLALLLCFVAFMSTDIVAQLGGSAGSGGASQSGRPDPNPQGPDANRGGAANADFDSLIDLIISTVASETWAENGGGEAEIRPFPGGVLVDAAGTLKLKSRAAAAGGRANDLVTKRGVAPRQNTAAPGAARKTSALRYVSLPRLERAIARRQAARQPLDVEMLTLAGLERVRYVFVYPESGDLVLAGPAGDWRVDADGRIVSTQSGEAIVRLDDLIVLLRRGEASAESHFGCSINPRQEALAKTQTFLAASSQRPLQPGQRKRWLQNLRDTVGMQDIEVFGVDPASRVAGVLVEADYHMKLIGMGLAFGVNGVESYLDSVGEVAAATGTPPPPMSVLRWWFALDYESIHTSPDADAFELIGQGVRVLSENELLAEQGKRVHTGQSEPLNRQFAEDFTAHFAELAKKYPVYSELRNIFDLAMAVALIQSNGLLERAGWQPGALIHAEQLRLPQQAVPRQVETVVNHRLVNRRQIIAGVSGGVMVAPSDVLAAAKGYDDNGNLAKDRQAAPAEIAAGAWWWDAE